MMHRRYVAWMLLTIGSAVVMTSYTNCAAPEDFKQPSSSDLSSLGEPDVLDAHLAHIQINDGAIATNSKAVKVEALLFGATQIYLTEDPECATGGEWIALESAKSWQFSKANQEVTLYAKFKNANAEETECISDSITHDDKVPALTLLDKPASSSSDKTAVLTFSGKDALSGIKNFECALDSEASYKSCTSPAKYTVKDGTHKIFVRARDKAGNEEMQSVTFKVDATAPATTFSKSPDSESSSKEATFAFTSPTATSLKCKLDNATLATCTSPKVYNNLSEGLHTFEIEAKDAAGNVSTTTKKWIVDTVAPTLKLTATPKAVNSLSQFAFKFDAADATSGLSKIQCSLDSAAYVTCGSLAGYDLNPIKVGKHTLKLRAVDKAGNKSAVVSATWEREMDVAKVSSPVNWQVVQRNNNNLANIPVKVSLTSDVTKIRVRLLTAQSAPITERTFTRTESQPTASNITDIMYAAAGGGWYQMQISLYDADNLKVAEKIISKVGVGEVFLTAGQSNSTRYGEKPIVNGGMSSFAEYIDSTGKIKWRHDIDLSSDKRGTTWSPFADKMAAKLKVPVAIALVGCGGTRVSQWLPENKGALPISAGKCVTQLKGGLYARLLDAAQELRNFRAILWHQGEGDSKTVDTDKSTLTSYPKDFATIVSQLNLDTEKSIPWISATVSYLPGNEVNLKNGCQKTGKPIERLTAMNKFRAMKKKLVTDKVTLLGPDSDAFWGPYRGPVSGDCTHFSYEGQVGLGKAWADSTLKIFESKKWGQVY